MGKKHKKYYKPDSDLTRDESEESQEKPGLKLVLKVGGAPATPDVATESQSDNDTSDTDKKLKHRKKKKRTEKSRDRSLYSDKKKRVDSDDDSDSDVELPASLKRPTADDADESTLLRDSVPARSLREKRPATTMFDDERNPLEACLNYLHTILHRKDVNGFFAFPVTDNIAPGYSSVIEHPMDFSTMESKIDGDQYRSVSEYKSDYVLMMNNCIMYNHPETVYHKEAKRLLAIGLKHMSRERLLQMKRSLPSVDGITTDELGFEDDGLDSSQSGGGASERDARRYLPIKSKQKKLSIPNFESIDDDLSADEILEQAQAAAQAAADKLTLRAPNSKIGFLRRREDGSTSLSILNPDNTGIVSETERVVNLGALVGKLTSGTGSLTGVKDDKRNKVNPVNYLNYGAFSSYAPIYDSSTANITKDESDLLLSTYGDETGLQYSKSLMHFVSDSGDYAVRMVDNLLDILTAGEHSKTAKILQEREEERQQQERQRLLEEQQRTTMESGVPSDVGAQPTRSLTDMGVDMSFLDAFERSEGGMDDGALANQKRLDAASLLLSDLQRVQYERLGQKPPIHLSYVAGPSTNEHNLAQRVSSELVQLVKQVTPGDVAGMSQIRHAMGMTLEPDGDPDNFQPITSQDDGLQPISSQYDMNVGQEGVADGVIIPRGVVLDEDFSEFFDQSTAIPDSDVGMELAENQLDQGQFD